MCILQLPVLSAPPGQRHVAKSQAMFIWHWEIHYKSVITTGPAGSSSPRILTCLQSLPSCLRGRCANFPISAGRICLIMSQIEGFKLHVAHITKPFTGKVRFAPEVASKPDRLAKDLVNAKALAATLEAEYDGLRKMKFEPKPEENGTSGETNGTTEQQDVPMTTISEGDNEEDPEPRERGSDAVERRIEKVMADLREQNALDFSDEKAVEARRVGIPIMCALLSVTDAITDGGCSGPVSCLSPISVQHMLLLRCRY